MSIKKNELTRMRKYQRDHKQHEFFKEKLEEQPTKKEKPDRKIKISKELSDELNFNIVKFLSNQHLMYDAYLNDKARYDILFHDDIELKERYESREKFNNFSRYVFQTYIKFTDIKVEIEDESTDETT